MQKEENRMSQNLELSCEHSQELPYNFPDFLYEGHPEVIEWAKNAVLSTDEIDMCGYTHYVDTVPKKAHSPSGVPYDYMFFKDNGGFISAMHKLDSIRERVGSIPFEAIYQYTVYHPGEPFVFTALPKKTVMELLKDALEPGCRPYFANADSRSPEKHISLLQACREAKEPIVSGISSPDLHEWYWDEYELKKEFGHVKYSLWKHMSSGNATIGRGDWNDICDQCFNFEMKDNPDPQYLEKKKLYQTLKEKHYENPREYPKIPEFRAEYMWTISLSETGKKLLEWYEE